MELTVAICTYRRAEVLRGALESLAGVERLEGSWEVLVVDNGCQDEVREVVGDFVGRLPIRYESEGQVGIARARNRAVRVARGEVILFADDDVRFDRWWLVNMERAIREHPECVCWGGRIEPIWPGPRPVWFDLERCPMLKDVIVWYDLGERSRYWDPRPPQSDPPFYTANLALRREAVEAVGLFDERLGHQGEERGSGEDSWMVRSLYRVGGRAWYAADAVVYHPVEERRLTKRYIRGFAWRQGRFAVQMLRREDERGRVPRWLYRVAAEQMMRGAGQWVREWVRGDEGGSFAGQYLVLFNFSKLWHAVAG